MSATISMTYDATNIQAQQLLEQLLTSGYFRVNDDKEQLEVMSAEELSQHTCSIDTLCNNLQQRAKAYIRHTV